MWSLFSSRRRQPSQPRRATCKPRLETLENRWVPSGFAANAGLPNLAGQLVGSGQGVGTDAAGDVFAVGYVGGTLSASDTDGYVVKYSPTGDFRWQQIIQGLVGGGNSFADSADVIAVDAAGNSYVAGNFYGTLKLGNFTLTSTGALDVFVEKLDTLGNVLWVHQFANTGNFGPPSFDRLGTCAPKGIVVDHAGNVVVTGAFTGHTDMDPANPGQHFLDYPAPGQSGHPDAYVVKLDANGNFTWEAQVVNVERDGAGSEAIAVDAHNNVYVLGGFANHFYFNDKTADNSVQQGANALTLTGPDITNLDVWKLNADGTNAWVSQVTSQAYNAPLWGLGIAVDKHGDIYTTGAFNGAAVDFDPTVSHSGNPDIVTSPNFNFNTFVDKMDGGGHWLWTRQISSTADNWGRGLTLDSAGNPYITGFLSGDSMLGNFLLTPASSAGNSYIAKLSPQGVFLNAAKSLDLSPDGDKAEAIAVDSQGSVDIVGSFASNMNWPGLPALTSPGGSDLFVVKTGLPLPTIQLHLEGTVLHLTGTDVSNRIVMTQMPNGDTMIDLAEGLVEETLVYRGLTRFDLTSGNGDDSFTLVCPSDASNFPVPDLSLNMGNGINTASLTADLSRGIWGPWEINVNTGDGTNSVVISILGSVPVDMTANLGDGSNSLIYELHNVEQMPLPSTVTVHSRSGVNDILLKYGFLPAVQSTPQSPITVVVDGGGTNHIDYESTFEYPAWWFAGQPAAFYIPLTALFHGDGYDTVNVGYHFLNAPGVENGIIAVLAPITLDVSGTGMNSVQVEFAPPDDPQAALVQIDAALTFDIHGGDHSGLIALLLGGPDTIGNPELMPGGSLDVRLVGGAGGDTITCVVSLAPGSMGQVHATILAGAGNDDLTLDLRCPDDNNVAGLIVLGPGNDTVFATSNVIVRR
jgi:hypothetical protein